VRLDPRSLYRLDLLASRNGQHRSQLIRDAVIAFLALNDRPAGGESKNSHGRIITHEVATAQTPTYVGARHLVAESRERVDVPVGYPSPGRPLGRQQ
jgi:predicted transcriptional regulator